MIDMTFQLLLRKTLFGVTAIGDGGGTSSL